MVEKFTQSDEELLDRFQRAAFGYFLAEFNAENGLVADTSRAGSPCSIAVVGFALSAYPVAVERGWMTRADAVDRTLATLRFFCDSEQSDSPEATGFKGFYYHFLDMHSGARVWRSELSMIDSALLVAGMLTAGRYFTAKTPEETALRALVETLYLRIDWRWSQGGSEMVRMGWKPESGFLNYCWGGYSEAILLYALALGSPTLPIAGGCECYDAWTATYQWENLYGYDFLYAGPLFIHQFPHAWIDFRGIRDRFMREKRCDYFENSRRATEVQREYARRNLHGFTGYDENCWGLTACDGPSNQLPELANERHRLFGYAARGVPYGPDDGTLGGWAALASLPFAPEIALCAVRTMLQRYPEMLPAQRYTSSVNPTLVGAAGQGAWVSAGHFGLDQGIVVMMIENHRSQLIWRLMRDCPYVVTGLRRAGFRGGWL
ncbi:glucoamylase family protein [Phaeovulum sp.]|uniref:glucoamylase family protein n=2 Tax=Phaeovulum sp. TaxID=2934796 RepID=UPI002ABB621E|nr:glucoamylase family protein [Phaeovulum sp.]MDZ4117917.1 glucoamylase family protein [Phaeovulum sp.]